MATHISRHKVAIGDFEIHYSVVGEGEPLVLVHGLSASTLWWFKNVPALAQHYRVYLVDLPGFGRMRRFHRHFSLDQAAGQLDLWARAIGLESACFVGHSMGGYICLALAELNPRLVKKLVLVATIGVPTYRSVLAGLMPLLKAMGRTRPGFWPILVYDALRAGPRTVLGVSRQIITQDAHALLERVTMPTLLIWGENDDLVPLKCGYQLRQDLPAARLLILAGANHICMFDQFAAFNAAVLQFLAGELVGS